MSFSRFVALPFPLFQSPVTPLWKASSLLQSCSPAVLTSEVFKPLKKEGRERGLRIELLFGCSFQADISDMFRLIQFVKREFCWHSTHSSCKVVMEMDLASLQSVRDFAEQYTGPVAGSSTF